MSALPSHPMLYVDGISSLAETGLQPHIITGILLQLVREHFADPERIKSPYLKSCIWVPKEDDQVTPDPEATQILIDPVYRWNLTTTQMRPAVVIKRNALTPRKVGIAHNRSFGLGEDDYPEAGSKHSAFLEGGHTLFCIARDGGAVEVLATEVSQHLYQFAPVIQREFCFGLFELAQIGEVSVLEESEEHFVVPIVLHYAYEDRWLLAKQEPRLKGVSVNARIDD